MNVIKQETGNPENTDTGLPRQLADMKGKAYLHAAFTSTGLRTLRLPENSASHLQMSGTVHATTCCLYEIINLILEYCLLIH